VKGSEGEEVAGSVGKRRWRSLKGGGGGGGEFCGESI